MFSSPIPWQEITPELLEQARQKWQQSQPDNYDMEIKFDGPRAAVYRLEVRNGRAFAAMRDGVSDAQTLRMWSVSGMFDTIEQDLKHATDPIRVSRREVNYVTPLGVFHPIYGYPQHYRRVQWGFNVEVTWEVTHFAVVDAAGEG